MDTDLFGGSDDSDAPDSDAHIVSVAVSHETLCQLNTVLESIEAPDGIRSPLRREIHQYESYANYTPTFSSTVASAIMYFASTGSATMLFSDTSATSYMNAARRFTVAYLHGLRRAYERDSTIGREQIDELDHLLGMLDETPAMTDALSRLFGPDSSADGGVFDADTLDPDDNPFEDDTKLSGQAGNLTVESEQLDKDPEYETVTFDDDATGESDADASSESESTPDDE